MLFLFTGQVSNKKIIKTKYVRVSAKMKIKKYHIYFLLLLPYIEPQLFKREGFEIVDKLFLVCKLMSTVVLAYMYFNRKKYRLFGTVFLMTLVQGITFIATIYNHGSVTRFLGPALISVSMIMLGELIFETDWMKFLDYLEKYLGLLFVLNIITFVMKMACINPFFSARSTFLGIDNRWIYFYLPWVIVAFINSYVKKGRVDFKAWMIYICSFISLAIVWSTGAMVAFMSLPVAYFCKKYIRSDIRIKKPAQLMYVLILIVNVLLVTGMILDFFSPVIINLLHKDITLSGRTLLWDVVVNLLKEKPFFGMGVQSHLFDMEYFYVNSGYCSACEVNHPHNTILNVAYHGGLIAAAIFILVVYIAVSKIDRIKNKELTTIFYCSAAALFVAALVDTLDFSLFYLLIPVVMQIQKKGNFLLLYRNANIKVYVE